VHPKYDWFGDLGLRRHANPAISNMTLEIGGVSYTTAPFSGWYVSSALALK
jgi:nitric-oxide synthase, bacterial